MPTHISSTVRALVLHGLAVFMLGNAPSTGARASEAPEGAPNAVDESPLPTVRTGMRTGTPLLRSAAAPAPAPLPDYFDPAAQNAAVEPDDKKGDPEIFMATLADKTATSTLKGADPKKLFSVAKRDETTGNWLANVIFKVGNMREGAKTNDYRVVCLSNANGLLNNYAEDEEDYPYICGGRCTASMGSYSLNTNYSISPLIHVFALVYKGNQLPLKPISATVVVVSIQVPHGNPELAPLGGNNEKTANSTNELVFTATTPNPANGSSPTCSIICVAESTPLAKKLRWEIKNGAFSDRLPVWHFKRGGNDATSTLGEGITAKAVYKGLFEMNDEFGKRTVQLSMDVPDSGKVNDETSVELFFLPQAKNHPGNDYDDDTKVKTPNWYYYWAVDNGGPAGFHRIRQTTTLPGAPGARVSWRYQDALLEGKYPAFMTGDYGGPLFKVTLTGGAFYKSFSNIWSSNGISFPGKPIGEQITFPRGKITIDYQRHFAIDIISRIIIHELTHCQIYYSWREDGPWGEYRTVGSMNYVRNEEGELIGIPIDISSDLGADDDGDSLPTSFENGFGTRWDRKRTYDDFYHPDGDDEIKCEIEAQGSPLIPAALDWSFEGKSFHSTRGEEF